mmetsp:Transcript_8495/g.11201  ORF Transcript_8495/g.11201 Transcript_8495/m.11201 type:complete len:143 (+) Transcript_8495:150-578(+)|eukprot:CAMPEP_0198143110 /NCGR_PEP_ID=MMETSP1443-20131203/5797_1 /TAXON_ID=186043 /ORGANISM="Entomoneis sp., Strain CCMP2396" /LENGTH=142 /DNA_ID=CAMNT_0043806253 /DNA_START=127 /DNA_END=555 /DNA_ORIENTATION=-
MMKFSSILSILFLLLSTASAFQAPKPMVASASSTALNVFGNKKSAAAKAAAEELAAQYWQGEWVCKDCGYIYQRAECAGLFFEEQGPGFRCPQCSGPRRRYAKKVGDRVGTTLDGGDAPILIFSFGGVIATIAFGIWAVNNL